jgi:glutamyl-tRNA reductase
VRCSGHQWRGDLADAAQVSGVSSARQTRLERLELVGASYRSAPFEALERLALTPEEIAKLYRRLAEDGAASGALVLSTCNRTEIYAHVPDDHEDAASYLSSRLLEVVGRERFPSGEAFYRHSGQASAEHMFRVASGLDSMILGEQQILGQLKAAYADAGAYMAPSNVFDRVVQSAFRVAARTRAETEIGKGAVSTASAAVHLATRVYGDLSRCCVVVVGAGETGRLLAQHFASHYPQRLIIVNRTQEKAAQLAREVNGEAASLGELPELLHAAHIVTTAVRSPTPVITAAMLEDAANERRGNALALVDLGLPRNVEAPKDELGNVFIQDLQALQSLVDGNLARRKRAVPQAETMVRDELVKLEAWESAQGAGPLIAGLREAIEVVRAGEVERVTRGMTTEQREAVEKATRAVVNKLMHGPVTSIKEYARHDEGEARIQVIRDVFRHLHVVAKPDDES